MGSFFGGGGKAADMQKEAMWREQQAQQKADELAAKQTAESDKLKAEEDTTKAALDTRRRRVASGAIGRTSLFSAGETGFTRTLGAA